MGRPIKKRLRGNPLQQHFQFQAYANLGNGPTLVYLKRQTSTTSFICSDGTVDLECQLVNKATEDLLEGEARVPVSHYQEEINLKILARGGSVVRVDIENPGSGYTYTPSVTVTQPGHVGEEATIEIKMEGGRVVDAIITNPGSGYEDGYLGTSILATFGPDDNVWKIQNKKITTFSGIRAAWTANDAASKSGVASVKIPAWGNSVHILTDVEGPTTYNTFEEKAGFFKNDRSSYIVRQNSSTEGNGYSGEAYNNSTMTWGDFTQNISTTIPSSGTFRTASNKDGKICLVYKNSSNQIISNYFDGTAWSGETIAVASYSGNTAIITDMDDLGNVIISWSDGPGQPLNYSIYNGASWSAADSAIDASANLKGAFSSGISNSGYSVCVADVTMGGEFTILHRIYNGSFWSNTESLLLESGRGTNTTRTGINNNNQAYVCWLETSNASVSAELAVKARYFDGYAWSSTETLFNDSNSYAVAYMKDDNTATSSTKEILEVKIDNEGNVFGAFAARNSVNGVEIYVFTKLAGSNKWDVERVSSVPTEGLLNEVSESRMSFNSLDIDNNGHAVFTWVDYISYGSSNQLSNLNRIESVYFREGIGWTKETVLKNPSGNDWDNSPAALDAMAFMNERGEAIVIYDSPVTDNWASKILLQIN